jgi:hypothetical protein
LTRSLAQLEQTALNHLRAATYGLHTRGLKFDDDDVIDVAVSLMGEEHRALIGRVHAREFKINPPN